jgi:hypothetical protein
MHRTMKIKIVDVEPLILILHVLYERVLYCTLYTTFNISYFLIFKQILCHSIFIYLFKFLNSIKFYMHFVFGVANDLLSFLIYLQRYTRCI